MSSLRKKALVRLLLCAVVLIATIVFSVLLLNGTFDGDAEPASDATSSSEVVSDAPSEGTDSAPAEGESTAEGEPASESVAEPLSLIHI